MAKYCFILGRNPLLSLAEIFNREALVKSNFNIIDLTSQSLIVATEKKFDPKNWQSALGGSIKIGQIVQEHKDFNQLIKTLSAENLLQKFFNQKGNKIVFGFSLYGDLFKHSQAEFNRIGLQLKKELKDRGYKSRFLASQEGDLTSVQVAKNKLIERGADILVIKGIHAFYLGKTLTVQDFEEYSQKDYGRPSRDAKSGMLPPKIAKIMINLARTKQTDVLLDPFCGSGTILQEAMLLGIQNIIGSDISQRAMADTRQNLAWLGQKYKLNKVKTELHVSDIKEINKKISPLSIDKIVTEPYLGPPLKKEPSLSKIKQIVKELESLYLAAFKAFDTLLKPNGRVAIIFPLFRHKDGVFILRILESLEQQGFKRINPIPEKVSLFAKVGPTARGSLIYKRADQLVEREIFVFQKV